MGHDRAAETYHALGSNKPTLRLPAFDDPHDPTCANGV